MPSLTYVYHLLFNKYLLSASSEQGPILRTLGDTWWIIHKSSTQEVYSFGDEMCVISFSNPHPSRFQENYTFLMKQLYSTDY